jgi:uncharacterized protein with HEPN domain
MSDFESPGVALDSPAKRRSAGSRFSELGDRIARTFAGVERARADTVTWAPPSEGEYPADGEHTAPWEQLQPPFPLVRHGYEPTAVDEYITELEQELEDLRSRTPEDRAISREIDRIGEQTAAILRVAHEKAQEVTREAQAQADRCVADAAANALAITDNANQRVRELDSETDVVWHERVRLIEDVRGVATALFTLAEDALERYPAEPEKVHHPKPVDSEPSGPEATGD